MFALEHKATVAHVDLLTTMASGEQRVLQTDDVLFSYPPFASLVDIRVLDKAKQPVAGQFLTLELLRSPSSVYGDLSYLDNCELYICKDHDGDESSGGYKYSNADSSAKDLFRAITSYPNCKALSAAGACKSQFCLRKGNDGTQPKTNFAQPSSACAESGLRVNAEDLCGSSCSICEYPPSTMSMTDTSSGDNPFHVTADGVLSCFAQATLSGYNPVVTYSIPPTNENGTSQGFVMFDPDYPGVFQIAFSAARGTTSKMVPVFHTGVCMIADAFGCTNPDSVDPNSETYSSFCRASKQMSKSGPCANSPFHSVSKIEIVTQPAFRCEDSSFCAGAANCKDPAYSKDCPLTCGVCVPAADCADHDALVSSLGIPGLEGCSDALSLSLCTQPQLRRVVESMCKRSCGKCAVRVGDRLPIQPVVRLVNTNNRGVSGLRVRALAPGTEYFDSYWNLNYNCSDKDDRSLGSVDLDFATLRAIDATQDFWLPFSLSEPSDENGYATFRFSAASPAGATRCGFSSQWTRGCLQISLTCSANVASPSWFGMPKR